MATAAQRYNARMDRVWERAIAAKEDEARKRLIAAAPFGHDLASLILAQEKDGMNRTRGIIITARAFMQAADPENPLLEE